MKNLPRWAGNTGLLFGGVAVSLLVAELALRWTGYEYRPLKIGFGDVDQRSYHTFEDRHFIYDPDLLWRPRPGFAVFNTQRFRGPELPREKPAGEFRIFTVGDSNTLGSPEANWPGDLHRILRKSCDRFQVVNAGVWGYSSDQGVLRLEEVLEYHPDLVLISFGSNDAHPVGVPDKEYTARSAWSGRLEGITRPSRVARLALAVSTQLTVMQTGEMTHRVSLEDYRSNLEEMARRVSSAGAATVLLTRPYQGKLPQVVRWKSFAHDYNAMTAEVAESLELPLVDLFTRFKDLDELFDDESHFNPQGHRLAAEIVYQRIQPLIRGSGLGECLHSVQSDARPDDSE